MKIVIAGDGKVGYTLASQLSTENHDVTLIDNAPETLRRTTESLDVIGVEGNGASYVAQREAGVNEADLLIAVTSSDEVNIICCLLAKTLGARHTIARIRNPEYAEQLEFLKESLGLSMTINPEKAAAREIVRIINFPSAISVKSLVRDRVELVECKIMQDSTLSGRKLADVHEKYKLNVLLCIIERRGKIFIPSAGDVFEADDKIHITGSMEDIVTFMRLAGHEEHKVRNVMIVGGGRISYYLAQRILKLGLKVKIIEKDEARCHELCDLLPEALIINGDGTEQNLLEEEQIENADIFIAMTGIDEENIIVSMFAVKSGVKKVIVKIDRMEYANILDDIDIDSFISPKLITAYQIIRYVRAMQNTIGSKVNALVRIANERAEVLEFIVAKNTLHQGEPLKAINFKENIVFAAIVHKNKLIVPHGDSVFLKGDSVIIVTMNHKFTDMNDIFADDKEKM
ncbi:MAG TPA: Trk system potassium transporter TrkA [Ruminococcaceae bacterium]|nr:Trk system potassium transporter TrkA [Oscillospiraceae bacterium]